MGKLVQLRALARKRQKTVWPGFKSIADYAEGAFECDHVSPYTKSAGSHDSDLFIMLQDWCSDEWINENPKFHNALGMYGLCPTLRTNVNLTELLREVFRLELNQIYATNLFPFIKPGNISSDIDPAMLVKAAHEFGLPQVKIVQPKLVICLGLPTFSALEAACGRDPSLSVDSAIDSPFSFGGARFWCQAHTGHWGQVNRNKCGGRGQVLRDWQKMKEDFVKLTHNQNRT